MACGVIHWQIRVHLGSLRYRLFLVVCSTELLLLLRTSGPVAPAPQEVMHSFDRVLLLEEEGETSVGVNVADLNGDGRHPL